MTGGQPGLPQRFVGIPAPAVRRITRGSTWLGVVTGVLGLAALPAAVVLPYRAVPDDEPLRIWLTLIGSVAAAGALAAAAGALSARSWVRSGYLDLSQVRSTRSALRAACTIATLAGAAAFAIYLRIVSSGDARIDWAYVGVLVVAVALPYLTLVALRRLAAPPVG